MDKTVFMQKAANGVFTAEDQNEIADALMTHQAVQQFQTQALTNPALQQLISLPALQPGAAINWGTILSQVLPIILGLFTGGAGGALIPLINLFLQIFKIPPLPVPNPTPVPPSPVPPVVIPPTPV